MNNEPTELIRHRDNPELLAAYAVMLARELFSQIEIFDDAVIDDDVSPLHKLANMAAREGIFEHRFQTEIFSFVTTGAIDRMSQASQLRDLCTALHRFSDIMRGRKLVSWMLKH